jgi:protein SCO1/2
MKRIGTLLAIIIVFTAGLWAQARPFNPDDIEVGIVERLDSLIPLELNFLNEKGENVSLSSLIDKPTVLSFVYYDCPGMCGPLLSGVSDVVSKLDMELGKDYQVITFSFDPKDTPEKGAAKKLNYVQSIDEKYWPYWHFLTADQETITKITAGAGWKYKPQGLDFAHPSAIMITSPEGKLTRYLYGIDYLPFDLKMALIEAQRGEAKPTINKVLEFCFAYDPQGRTYTLQITRIVGSFILIIALIIFGILMIKGRRKTEKS